MILVVIHPDPEVILYLSPETENQEPRSGCMTLFLSSLMLSRGYLSLYRTSEWNRGLPLEIIGGDG